MEQSKLHLKGFIPYALSAFLVSIVGGFSAVLGPAFVQAGIVVTARTVIEPEPWKSTAFS